MLNIEIPPIKKDTADTEAAELLQAYADHKISKQDLRAIIAEMWRMLAHRKQEIMVMAACRLWWEKNGTKSATHVLWEEINNLYGEKRPTPNAADLRQPPDEPIVTKNPVRF